MESAEAWMKARKTEIPSAERDRLVESVRATLEVFHEMEEQLVGEDLVSDDARLVDLMNSKPDRQCGHVEEDL